MYKPNAFYTHVHVHVHVAAIGYNAASLEPIAPKGTNGTKMFLSLLRVVEAVSKCQAMNRRL